VLNYLVNNILLASGTVFKGITLVALVSYITLGCFKSLDPWLVSWLDLKAFAKLLVTLFN
jgi:hypothetical protein